MINAKYHRFVVILMYQLAMTRTTVGYRYHSPTNILEGTARVDLPSCALCTYFTCLVHAHTEALRRVSVALTLM
jgi:hypothetical protein